MKAMVCESYGQPDVLHPEEVEKPAPGDNEILVKVYTSTVSAPDWRVRSANPFFTRLIMGLLKPRNKILGYEFSGEIVATGKNVTRFSNGEQVFGMNVKGMNIQFGAYAEYLCMPEDWMVLPRPESIDHRKAAVLPSGAITALLCLRSVQVSAGDKVLVNGASGSIGTAAVQLAKHLGAEVTGVCSTVNLELVRSIGADHVIDYTAEDFTENGQSWDFIFDTVGKRSFLQCKNSLNPDGTYISTGLGYFIQNLFFVFWTSILGTKKAKLATEQAELEHLVYLTRLVEEGKFKPVIDRCYPLDEVAQAHRYVEKGHKKGNVVIIVRPHDIDKPD